MCKIFYAFLRYFILKKITPYAKIVIYAKLKEIFMFKTVTPESVGVSSHLVQKYINSLNKRGYHMHSVLMMRGEDIFCECYWKPFSKDLPHRMYSVTKSFVSIAIGLLVEDGLIDLKEKIAAYFPEKIDTPLCENLANQTVEEMLTMSTAGSPVSWFSTNAPDRTRLYFADYGNRRTSGAIWEYDSAGSQVLSSLVEKIAKKSLFDFLNERIFTHLGTFKDATVLKTRNGDSWGDSAMICTSRDLLSFARFVMNYGVYNGKRLMNEEYLKKATSKVVDNLWFGHRDITHMGYGYQIWKTEEDGFAFVGMGNQLAVCIPKYEFIFVCTADTQGNTTACQYIVSQLFDLIVSNLSDTPLDENKAEYQKLLDMENSQELFAHTGLCDSPMREKINNRVYECYDNPMGIKRFHFEFDNAESGKLVYENENGELELEFYVNKNRFGKFPELGYSNDFGGLRTTDGFKYDDAVSLAWLQDNKLIVFTQIIDRYLGNMSLIFGFKDNKAVIYAHKDAEDFLWNYNGVADAYAIN